MTRYTGNDYEIIAERMCKAEERRARRRAKGGAMFGSVEKPRAATMSAPDRSEADRALKSDRLGRTIDQWLDSLDLSNTQSEVTK